MSQPSEPGTPAVAKDPWNLWAWLLATAWLIFLVFPIMTIWNSTELTSTQRMLGLTIIAIFAVTYSIGFARAKTTAAAVVALVVLMALSLALTGMIWTAAVSLVPFIVALAVFHLPWVAAIIAGAVVASIGVSAILFGNRPGLQVLLLIIPMVYGFMLLLRIMERWGERHRELSQQLVIVNERDRLARDVHDVVGHSLTAVAVKSELAHRLVDSDPARAKTELAQIQALVRESLVEVRATVAGLRVTSIGEELGVAQNMLVSAGIRPHLPGDADSVDPSHRIVMGWALRESVTNVVRHSQARTCTIELGPRTLTIADDGIGLNAPDGNGLRGLRERIQASGGSLAIGTGPGAAGTELRFTWPQAGSTE
ncbi:MAG: sensor histidine kinase [Beutenbergiaceae bacterium]